MQRLLQGTEQLRVQRHPLHLPRRQQETHRNGPRREIRLEKAQDMLHF